MEAFCYIDGPQTGLMNMAIDDAMLDFANANRVAVLRLYQWSESTLSLGYFQKIEDRAIHAPSCELPVVRRATGGGAIVHHHDLTYALAVPQSSVSVGAAPAIYAEIHKAIVGWLNELDLVAHQWREVLSSPTATVEATASQKAEFLCFLRRSVGDVVVGNHKILGSAQRRSQGALLQHGSLLVGTSPYAPCLLGLRQILSSLGKQIASDRVLAEEMLLRLRRGIDALLNVRIKCEPSLAAEMREPATAKLAKFEAPQWRCRA